VTGEQPVEFRAERRPSYRRHERREARPIAYLDGQEIDGTLAIVLSRAGAGGKGGSSGPGFCPLASSVLGRGQPRVLLEAFAKASPPSTPLLLRSGMFQCVLTLRDEGDVARRRVLAAAVETRR
jgi:hypothetical protein